MEFGATIGSLEAALSGGVRASALRLLGDTAVFMLPVGRVDGSGNIGSGRIVENAEGVGAVGSWSRAIGNRFWLFEPRLRDRCG